jgi:glycerophosphoryl diester phosphodiesterase
MNARQRGPDPGAATVSVPQSSPVSTRYGDQSAPLAIAHRGGAGLGAENTIDAFARSYALGVRYLETDVRLSADRQLVAFPDASLHRVTGQRGGVGRRTLDELARLAVLGDGQIATLLEVLCAFPDANVTVDLKQAGALAPLADLLARAGAARRVCVAGTWDSSLTALRDLVGPDLTIALGWRSLVTMLARLRAGRGRALVRSGAFAHVPLRLGRLAIMADDLAERAHDIGVRVIVWTVNDPSTMHRLLDAGVDGVITDRPDLLREVLVSRDQWQPPAMTAHRFPAADLPL